MNSVYLRGFAQRAEGDDPDGPIRFIIATEGMKADGLDLRMDGLNLDRFTSNPVVMYGHQYYGRDSLPIGRAENVTVDGSNLLADTIFDMDDEFAAAVARKYRGGFLNAVSVGFDIRGIDPETGVVNAWDLIEYSAVPVPLDPDAVVESGRQRTLALASAFAEVQSGNGLSDGNRTLVAEAIETLSGLLATDPEADPDGEPRGLDTAAARLRLEQMERLAAI